MQKKYAGLAGLIILLSFHPAGFGEAVPARVDSVDKNDKVVNVSYQDPVSGKKQEMDMAVVPNLNSPTALSQEMPELKKGDKVVLDFEKDPATGMWVPSIIKTGTTRPHRSVWEWIGLLWIPLGLLLVMLVMYARRKEPPHKHNHMPFRYLSGH